MDEVENPALPAADESSPTIPPVPDDTQITVPLVSAEEEEAILPPGPEDPEVPPPKPPRPLLKRESSTGSALPPQQLPLAPPVAAAEELSQDAPDSLTLADQDHVVDRVGRGVGHRLLDRRDDSLEEVGRQLGQMGPRKAHLEVARLIVNRRDERDRDLSLLRRGELDLRLLGCLVEALQ